MLEINRNPSRRDLAWFGLALTLFFGVVGGIVLWRTGSLLAAQILWGIGVTVGVLYYAVPPLRRPVFVGWSILTYPLGWLLSYLVMAVIYYLLVTPIGWVLRLVRRDPMERRFDPDASSYWVERPPTPEPGRYFRQF